MNTDRIHEQAQRINEQAQIISDLLIAAETMYEALQNGDGITLADQRQAAAAIAAAKGQRRERDAK